MSTPAIIMIVLLALEFSEHATKDGQPRGNYSVGVKVLDILLLVGLLYWGGFFARGAA